LRTLDTLTKALRYQFTYDSNDRLTTITDGYGNVTTIERDTSGNPAAIVGPYGQRTTLTMNTNGYIEKITNTANESVQLNYTSDGLLTGKTDPNGNKYNFSYDDKGRLLRDSDPVGGLKTLSRSDSEGGYTVALNTAMNRTTTYQVENIAEGVQRRINTFPDGLQRERLKDKSNGTQTTSFPNGKKVTLALGPDPRWDMQSPIAKSQTISTGGLTSTSTQTRTVTQTNSDDPFSLGTLTDSTSINGRTYTNIYEADTRTFTNTTPAGRQMFTLIDAQGRVVREQVNGLLPANYNYDERGRLSSVTQGIGTDTRSSSLDYDSDGSLATITDPLGRTVEFEYSEAGRMTQQILPGGRLVRYAYDANNNITNITPDGRPTHTFAYTPVDLQSAYTPPKVGKKTTKTLYKYNTDRQLTSIKRPDKQTVKLGYDSAGRLSAVSKANLSYDYDATTGNLKTITRDGSNLSYGFDGTLLTDETWDGDITGSVGRTFDNNFRITSNSVNGTNTINFQYDDDGLLTQSGGLILSRNAQNGLITGSTLGNTTDTWSYNGFGEPTDYNGSYNGTPIDHIQYVRDKLGRIIEKTETVEGTTDTYGYTYDLAGRLTEITKNDTTIARYTYDSNGNRLTYTDSGGTINGSYDDQDRLMRYGTTEYKYTGNGELLKKTSGGLKTTYKYDVLGNLTAVNLPNSKKITYLIDGRNRRIGKKVNGKLVQGFLYQSSLRPVVELDNNGNIVSRFIYANRINVPDYLVKGGVTYRIITDHLGSPQLVVDVATGTVAQRMDYDEFGQVLSDTNPGFQPFGFAGGLYDRDTKLVRFGARDYDAETGRWTAKDPILFEGGDLNLYAYVGSDPVNFLDPTGKWELPTWEQTTEFVKSTGKNLVKSIKIGGKKAVPLPPVISTLSGAASAEGAVAERAAVDAIRKKVLDECLSRDDAAEEIDRRRNLSTEEFLREFAPGWNK
jgi:RHS repeat-associated protein